MLLYMALMLAVRVTGPCNRKKGKVGDPVSECESKHFCSMLSHYRNHSLFQHSMLCMLLAVA